MSESPSSDFSPQELVEAWNTICGLLDATGPSEAIGRVQTLTSQLKVLDQRDDIPDNLATLSEIEEVFARLHEQMAELRERNEQLERRLDATKSVGTEDVSGNDLLEALDAASYETALDRINTLQRKVDEMYEERQVIMEAGHDTAADLVEAARALQRENDRLNKSIEDRSTPSTEVLQAASAIRTVLGVSTIGEAETFVNRLDAISNGMRRALDHLGMDVPQDLNIDRAEDVFSFLEVLEGQIERLANAPLPEEDALAAHETLSDIESVLGIASAEEAREMEHMVRTVTEELSALAREHEVLEEAGLTAEEAVSMIESMDEQLDDLYVQHDVGADSQALPPGLQETLGVSSTDEAEELLHLAQTMDDQLTSLYEDRDKLNEIGVSTVEEAVRMIQDMNEQLVELYEEVEARSAATLLPMESQDTFQQLESLYANQEKLQGELGVSDPEAIIRMVENMNVQLETLYEKRDATHSNHEGSTDDSEKAEQIIQSMVAQLEALYDEKETLIEEGFASPEDAAEYIQALRNEVKSLREHETEADASTSEAWDKLKRELDVDHPQEVINLLESATTSQESNGTSVAPASAEPSTRTRSRIAPVWQSAPDVADADTLSQLPTHSTHEHNALSFGVIEVDADGCIQQLNNAAYALPLFDRLRSMEEAHGQDFFLEIAPSTATDTFYGRFYEGRQQRQLNARFPHCFTEAERDPFVAFVHLYYHADSDTYWILLAAPSARS